MFAKRSYVGMKMRRKTVKVTSHSNDTNNSPQQNSPIPPPPVVPSIPTSSEHEKTHLVVPSAVPPGPAQVLPQPNQFGNHHSLLHLPLPLAQSPYVLSSIPPGYAPVIHPMRFVPNSVFHNSVHPSRPSTAQVGRAVYTTPAIDWSQHAAYTPLEITDAYPQYPTSIHQVESDWRDQIYYWSGVVEYDNQEYCLAWNGRWLGSFTGKPSIQEMRESMNEFSYKSPRIDRAQVYPHASKNDGYIVPYSGYYQGFYLMDNDGTDEYEEYTDKELILDFELLPQSASSSSAAYRQPPIYQVVGKGDSEFGAFLIQGIFHAASKELEMSRQYIPEHDFRVNMTVNELKHWMKQSSRQTTHPHPHSHQLPSSHHQHAVHSGHHNNYYHHTKEPYSIRR
jgi:hypothetical protein